MFIFILFCLVSVFFLAVTTLGKSIGAGLATIGVVGAGAGIGILFGSTASAVIHHLSCDALVVKIPELKA